MNDLNDMLVFATVVEQGSFTAAAEVLGTPKSNISRKITRLEQSLGVRLLERSTRTQHLTEVGRQYFGYCQRIKEEIEAAELAVESMLESPRGLLKVCASVGVGQFLLADRVAEFREQYPDIELDMVLTNRRVDVIEEGFDLVVRVGELPDSGLVARKLCQLRLNLYASPSLKVDSIDSPEGLLNYPLMYMSAKGSKAAWELISDNDNRQLTFNPVAKCDDFLVLKRLAAQGAGITELPDYIAEDRVDSGELVQVLKDWSFKPVDLYAIYPSHRGATPKVRAMVDFLSRTLL